ncbi:putative Zn(2)-C6 fungal-type domain-containing protein [Seiridium cardinale]|uniref:Zn(2)-C6 fungal-type domain-containing protein n=1 Tax=Seiridium cardinale TaxID=138064 RepID=A0ABR2XR63_9PEZI
MTPSITEDEQPVQEAPSSRKRKRNSRACDRCHRNACRPPRRKGKEPLDGNSPPIQAAAPSRRSERVCAVTTSADERSSNLPSQPIESIDIPTITPASHDTSFMSQPSHEHHVTENSNTNGNLTTHATELADVIQPDILEKLVEVYYHTAYPVRPYFHWPTYRAQIQSRQYRSDWGLYTFTMAVCTMAAGRLCDGVLMPTGPHPLRLQAATLLRKCYNAAVGAIPSDIMSVPDCYQVMKAKAILAAACLQNGDWKRAIAHLGDYASLSAMSGFCQESNWPSQLNEVQKQERRRVFWGVYQQEQYLSSNFNFASRQREVKAMVRYPAEVFDDDDITETGVQLWSEHISFIKGVNYCTDLYRILERMEGTVRTRQQATSTEPGGKIEALFSEIYPSKKLGSDSLHLVSQLYEELPQELKKPKLLTGDLRADRYGFIACNVLLTTQTLRMLLVGTGAPNVHLRCAIASELLDELSTIPVAFFHASSTVSLHHLAHIGHMLGGDVQDKLPIWTYLQVRNILIVLADFLEKIESDRMITTGLAEKLRTQIDRIDQCMKQTSSSDQETGLLSMGRSLLPDWQAVPPTSFGSRLMGDPDHRSPQAQSTTGYGTCTPMQTLFGDTARQEGQGTRNAHTGNSELRQEVNTNSLFSPNAMTMPGSSRDPFSVDHFQTTAGFPLPNQLGFDTPQPPIGDTMFPGDLFSGWPFLTN